MLFKDLKYCLLLNNDFNFYKKSVFIHNLNEISNVRPLDNREQVLLLDNIHFLQSDLNSQYSEAELRSLRQLYDSRNQKVYRLKKRIKTLIRVSDVYFLTLTFTNEVLNSTSAQTRRTYVQRYLSSLDYVDYYANIDFGSEDKNPLTNHREHYHAIIGFKKFKLIPWTYGFYYYEPINSTSKSLTKLSNYVNKLSYHAFKINDISSRCISPKKKFYPSLAVDVAGTKVYPIRMKYHNLPFDLDENDIKNL